MKKVSRIGEKHTTNEGYIIEIIDYFSAANCTIKFEDGNIIKNIQYNRVLTQKIKNVNHKSILEIGYTGVGNYSHTSHFKIYTAWNHMLQRCYNKKCQEKSPTYKDCLIEEDWYNFQNFAKWFEQNYKEGFALDKDILIKDNKIYSPNTCCFVPSEINNIFVKRDKKRGELPTGVYKIRNKFYARTSINSKRIHLGYFNTIQEAFQSYKIAKENYIKEIADKWKPLITPKTHQAMYNYKVEITD